MLVQRGRIHSIGRRATKPEREATRYTLEPFRRVALVSVSQHNERRRNVDPEAYGQLSG